MSEYAAWIEAVGTWIAPALIFGAGYMIGERRERRSGSMKVLIEASDHAQRLHYVCVQGQQANSQLMELRKRDNPVGRPAYQQIDKDHLHSQIRDMQAQLRLLNERRAELSVAMNSDCMMADVAFGPKATPLVSAIKGLISTTDNNDEAQVRSALTAVTSAISALAHEVLGRAIG
jgi:hypothetical protein